MCENMRREYRLGHYLLKCQTTNVVLKPVCVLCVGMNGWSILLWHYYYWTCVCSCGPVYRNGQPMAIKPIHLFLSKYSPSPLSLHFQPNSRHSMTLALHIQSCPKSTSRASFTSSWDRRSTFTGTWGKIREVSLNCSWTVNLMDSVNLCAQRIIGEASRIG